MAATREGPWGRLGVALIAAALLGLASPPASFLGGELCGVLGLALLCGLACSGRRAWIFVGLAYGLQLAWASVSLRFLSLPGFLAIPPFAALYAAILSGLLSFGLRGRSAAWIAPAFGCAITLLEFWRAQMPGMEYPHAQVAHAWYGWLALLGPVRIVGEAGMNFLLAAFSASIWLVLAHSWPGGTALAGRMGAASARDGATARNAAAMRATRRAGVISFGVVVCAWVTLAVWPSSTQADGEPIRVALVQTGVQPFPDQERFDLVADPSGESLIEHYRELAKQIPECELALWPESALGMAAQRRVARFIEGNDAEAHRAAARLFRGQAKRVAYGVTRIPKRIAEQVRRARDGEAELPRFLEHFNSVCYGTAGGLIGLHDKTRLVPGGETLPPWFTWLRSIDARIPKLSRGVQAAVFELEDGRHFGPAVCFENAFADHFADQARRGAGFFCGPLVRELVPARGRAGPDGGPERLPGARDGP